MPSPASSARAVCISVGRAGALSCRRRRTRQNAATPARTRHATPPAAAPAIVGTAAGLSIQRATSVDGAAVVAVSAVAFVVATVAFMVDAHLQGNASLVGLQLGRVGHADGSSTSFGSRERVTCERAQSQVDHGDHDVQALTTQQTPPSRQIESPMTRPPSCLQRTVSAHAAVDSLLLRWHAKNEGVGAGVARVGAGVGAGVAIHHATAARGLRTASGGVVSDSRSSGGAAEAHAHAPSRSTHGVSSHVHLTSGHSEMLATRWHLGSCTQKAAASHEYPDGHPRVPEPQHAGPTRDSGGITWRGAVPITGAAVHQLLHLALPHAPALTSP